MEVVLLDTALLAVPSYVIDADSTSLIVERVSYWARTVLADIPVRVVISDLAIEVIWAENCGPTIVTLEELFEVVGIGDVFSPQDVISAYFSILDKAEKGINVFGFEVDSFRGFAASPNISEGLNPIALVSETQRTLLSAGCARASRPFVSVGSAFLQSAPITVMVAAHDIEVRSLDAASVQHPKAVQDLPVPIITTLEDLIQVDRVSNIWLRSVNSAEVHFAIAMRALELIRLDRPNAVLSDLDDFLIGPGFVTSLSENQCHPGGRFGSLTLDLCAQIVAHRCSRHIGTFGRPKQEQRSWDSSLAFRVHVTEHSEGLRLMFWRTSHGIELANIGVKHQLYISTGGLNEAIAVKY